MYGSVLSVPDKRASELRDGLRSEQSGCVSVCHVSEGIAWAGAEVQVTTLLRSLSRCSGISLHAIVFRDGRLAQELRSLGVTVQVVNEHQKSIFQAISECSEFLKSRNIQILHSHNYKENLIALMLS